MSYLTWYPHDRGQSFVRLGNSGTWSAGTRTDDIRSRSSSWGVDAAPHEFGHLAGLKDRYRNVNGVSVSNPGWEGNIMADGDAGVEQRNINLMVGPYVNQPVDILGNFFKDPLGTVSDILSGKRTYYTEPLWGGFK